jgi:hypothetical protein
VGRLYGGILGLLAFQTTLLRGWFHHNDLNSTLWAAWLCLMIFAGVGVIIGTVASQIVRDSVIGRVNDELNAQELKTKEKEKKKKETAK